MTSVTSHQSSAPQSLLSSSGEDVAPMVVVPGEMSKKGSNMEDRLGRLLQRRSTVDAEPTTWAELFEQAGLSSTTAATYGAIFEKEKLDLINAMEIFGRNEKIDYLKSLSFKSSHIERVKKYCVRTKTGSLGGKRGSTIRPGGGSRIEMGPTDPANFL